MVATRSSGPASQSSPALELRSREVRRSASPPNKRKRSASAFISPSVVRRRKLDERSSLGPTAAPKGVTNEGGHIMADSRGSELLVPASQEESADVTIDAEPLAPASVGSLLEPDTQQLPVKACPVNTIVHVRFNDSDAELHQLTDGEIDPIHNEPEHGSGDDTDDDAPVEVTVKDQQIQRQLAALEDRVSETLPKRRQKNVSQQGVTPEEDGKVSNGDLKVLAPEDNYNHDISEIGSASEYARTHQANDLDQVVSRSLKFMDEPDGHQSPNSVVCPEPHPLRYGTKSGSSSTLPPKSTYSSARFRDNIFSSRKRRPAWKGRSAFVRAIST